MSDVHQSGALMNQKTHKKSNSIISLGFSYCDDEIDNKL